ncbi:RING finger protein 37-like [Penaeus indicus]|uniref:RING finger protein 37-like n=1 Tax=Penaeus indicus TaxID=29960 RepID=UPI00300CF968
MNFCSESLDPKISSSKPGADGREVSNLISEDPSARKKGFMGEYFIRPPIDVSLVFPVPVHISHIVINSRLDHMNSNGFSVFTRLEDTSPVQTKVPDKANSLGESSEISGNSKQLSETWPRSPLSDTSFQKEFYSCAAEPDLEASKNNFSESVASPEVKQVMRPIAQTEEKFEDLYFCVGKFFTQNAERIVLRNPHYQHWLHIPMPGCGIRNQVQGEYKGSLKHANRQALKVVKSMIIRIMCTVAKGPPVIQSLEVWGQPSITTSKSQKKVLLEKWKCRTQEDKTAPPLPRLYNSEPEATYSDSTKANASTSAAQDSLDIPEDFLDPLTCEVMSVPLLMPSGHSIDAHTLERFIANESIWGRPPSDPFTGVPFKQGQQPTPNVPLKARIDRFLLLNVNHEEVKKIGRTVGSADRVYGQWQHSYQNGSTSSSFYTKRKNESPERDRKLFKSESEGMSDKQKGLNKERDSMVNSTPEKLMRGAERKDSEEKLSNVVSKEDEEGKETNTVRKPSTSYRTSYHKPVSCPTAGRSSGHHSLVHMIGGVLSMAQSRGPQSKGIPRHKPNEKPPSLICGDVKQKEFDLPSVSVQACSCGRKEQLYALPCQHVLCRPCLQVLPVENKCSACKKIFKKSEVTKHHSKSIYS